MTLADLPSPFSRADALSIMSRRELDAALVAGEVRRIYRDVYVVDRPVDPTHESWQLIADDHLRQLRQVLRRFPGHAGSHISSSLAHGWPVVISPSSPVEIIAVDRCPRSRQEEGVVIHHTKTTAIPVTEIDGLRVTAEARGLVDTLRTRSLPNSTALVDEILRSGRLGEQDLLAVLAEQKRWPGRPKALMAIQLSDPRRESWLESYSDVVLLQKGISLPLPQVNIYDEHRRFVARVDGLDEEKGVFREADGEGKYFLAVAAGASPEESARSTLAAERVRHTRLESLGLRGVRWTTTDIVHDADTVANRVRRLHREPVPELRAYAEWEGTLRALPFRVERPDIDLEKVRTRRPRRRRGV